MIWFVLLFLGSLIAALHLLSLILLFTIKRSNMNGNQKYLLISLCLTEFCFGVSIVLRVIFHFLKMINAIKILHIFDMIPLYLVYLFIMIFITVDRLLEFRMNIKYSLYWSSKKTLIVLIIVFTTSISIFIFWVALQQSLVFEYREFVRNYVLPPFAAVFMILAIYTYYLIFKKLKENRTKNEMRTQNLKLQNSHLEIAKGRRTYRIFVPSLIIATFILFGIIPFVLLTLYYSAFSIKYEALHNAVLITFPLGWIVDAVIYIFSLKQVRRKLKTSICRVEPCIRK